MPYAHPEALVGTDWLAAHLSDPHVRVVDGSVKLPGVTPTARQDCDQAHIPGSRNVPYELVTDPATRQLKSADELTRLFCDARVALDRPIVTSCGSGVTACALAFALHLIGHPGAAVYDGSWSEWGLPGDTPIETGPAR